MLVFSVVIFFLGAALVVRTIISAIRTFVVPRGISDRLTSTVFRSMRRLFDLWVRPGQPYEQRDRRMALFAHVSLLALPAMWLTLVMAGYTAMFWAIGFRPVDHAISESGSSLFTLGFTQVHGLRQALLAFSEAAVGLTLLALLISYLPTMYAAFQRRETLVTMLETEAGSPPSALVILVRLHRIGWLTKIHAMWPQWQLWFADISESHTSLAALVFYRSPRPDRSWVTASGAVLDAAALVSSTLDLPRDPAAELCLRAGYLALRQIADLFFVPYDRDPHFPAHPISVTREEYDELCDQLAAEGIALKPDRDQTWFNFAGWRVTYDVPLLALAGLTMAPTAPWSGDRATEWRLPVLTRRPRDLVVSDQAGRQTRQGR